MILFALSFLIAVTRAEVIQEAKEHAEVIWFCEDRHVAPVPQCPDWTSDYEAGNTYMGEAYEWGGWDTPELFISNLNQGLRPGAHSDNDCQQWGDPSWATGEDCSGLVSRAWKLPNKHSTRMLPGISDTIPYDSLKPGDVLDKPGSHVVIFYSWVDSAHTQLLIYQATDRRPDPCLTALDLRYRSYYSSRGYIALRYKNIEEDTSVHEMDNNFDSNIVVFIADNILRINIGELSEKSELKLISVDGKVLIKKILTKTSKNIEISLKELPSGLYNLVINQGENVIFRRPIILVKNP